VEYSSTQQTFIDAPPEAIWELVGDPNRHPDWWPGVLEVECADLREGCRYREVVKGFLRAQEHDILIERLDTCQEVCISCHDTGVSTRFVLTGAQGGTFVEGHFAIEPNSVGMKVLNAISGRRFIRSWLEQSLENLKQVAERTPAPL
jgi:Polyketide cyclase / dehydrase and lipid transport